MDGFELKVLLRTLLLPPAGPLLLAAIGLLMLRRHPRAATAALGAGVAALWVLSMPVVADALARAAEGGVQPLSPKAWAAAREGPRPPRAVVVVGAGLVAEHAVDPAAERLQARSVQRVFAAARIARTTGLPVLVSGGQPLTHRATEAGLMRRVLEEDLGVRVRWVEDRSRDTAENAALSAQLLRADGIDSVVLVTHATHLTRTRRAFESVGIAVLPAPHDWDSGPTRSGPRAWLPHIEGLVGSCVALHELVGRLWYALILMR